MIERKVPVIVRPGAYTVSLERTDGLTFGHCDIHTRWTPTIKAALREDWRRFLELHEAPILALHTPGDRKHAKFLSIFGFRFIGSHQTPDGTTLEIFATGA